MPTLLEEIVAAQEIYYFGRIFSFPGYNQVGLSTLILPIENAVYANKLFHALQLPADRLRYIFQDGWCGLYDEAAWQTLAALTGKVIHLLHHDMLLREEGSRGRFIATYLPDGSIVRAA